MLRESSDPTPSKISFTRQKDSTFTPTPILPVPSVVNQQSAPCTPTSSECQTDRTRGPSITGGSLVENPERTHLHQCCPGPPGHRLTGPPHPDDGLVDSSNHVYERIRHSGPPSYHQTDPSSRWCPDRYSGDTSHTHSLNRLSQRTHTLPFHRSVDKLLKRWHVQINKGPPTTRCTQCTVPESTRYTGSETCHSQYYDISRHTCTILLSPRSPYLSVHDDLGPLTTWHHHPGESSTVTQYRRIQYYHILWVTPEDETLLCRHTCRQMRGLTYTLTFLYLNEEILPNDHKDSRYPRWPL